MNAEQVQERSAMLLAREQNNQPALWWMSFCDPDKPKGQRLLGVAIVEAPGLFHAHQKAWALGINPGGEMRACRVEGIPIKYHDRLL